MIWLAPEFAARLPRRWRDVDDAFRVQGRVVKEIEGRGRRTLRFELQGRGYYLKLHWGVGWREILKNLVGGRLPVLGAEQEWRALQKLPLLGIETMQLQAYGRKGWNPARLRSFVVTAELENTISLERYCAGWKASPPDPGIKWRLIERVAEMTRKLHAGGLNHRDLYLCHFLLQQPWSGGREDLHLYLIDLHRVQQRRRVPLRWQAKDLGSLWFSAMEIGLTRRDLLRFLRAYFEAPLRRILEGEQALLQATQRRALALQAKGIPDA